MSPKLGNCEVQIKYFPNFAHNRRDVFYLVLLIVSVFQDLLNMLMLQNMLRINNSEEIETEITES